MAPWFRPPYGDLDTSVLRDAGGAGYRWALMWTVDSLGWKGLSVPAITERCAKGAVNGAIFLFHVGSASLDGAALPGLIARFRRGGWRLWRVDHLVQG
jgi:peptidoglycan/xylan/chitin deacetylase (PgdA/CDA1 family)